MPLLAFDDVPILPYTFLNDRDRKVGGRAHQGGPLWPDWDLQTAARHCRCGQPIDDPPETRPIEETIDGPVAWAGAILTHFGHQIAEFSTRILPTLAERPDTSFVFAVQPEHGITELSNAPRHVAEILEWLGAVSYTHLTLPTKA